MEKLFNIITNFVEITGNEIVNNILLCFVGIISFSIAFGIVGIIFDAFGIYDSDLMSDCHWFIRLIVFLSLSTILIELLKFITWLFSFQWWIYLIAVIVIIGIIVLIYYLKHKISINKVNQQQTELMNLSDNEKQNKITETTKDFCPRCGAKLIKRHGPYGNFYGCENFSKTGCKYTRKFK